MQQEYPAPSLSLSSLSSCPSSSFSLRSHPIHLLHHPPLAPLFERRLYMHTHDTNFVTRTSSLVQSLYLCPLLFFTSFLQYPSLLLLPPLPSSPLLPIVFDSLYLIASILTWGVYDAYRIKTGTISIIQFN